MKTNAVDRWITRGVEQLIRLADIVVIAGHLSVVSPTLRRQNATRRLRLPAPQVFDHRPPVERVSDRLPNPHVCQDRIAEIESEGREPGSGRTLKLKIGKMRQRKYSVWRKRVDGQVAAALAQFESLRSRVGHDGKAHARQLDRSVPIIVVAFDDNLSVGLCANEPERA